MVTKCHSIVLAFVVVLCAGRANGAPVFRWHPVIASGNIICTPGEGACGGTEIILSDGGVTVTLFMEVTWYMPGSGGLSVAWATVDGDSYIGGTERNPGTHDGIDLVPVGYPDARSEGAYQAVHVCSADFFEADMADAVTLYSNCVTLLDCPHSHPFCLDRPDAVFPVSDASYGIYTRTIDYGFGAGSNACPKIGTHRYAGTLVLDVPSGAVGTYRIDFFDEPNYTSTGDCAGPIIIGWKFDPGYITIIPGGADCDGNGVPDQDELDSDGDDVIDACDGCPDDANKIDPGICGCGISDELDGDGDDVPDCVDQCPGVDDEVFAPDCVDEIPTMSTWGLVVTTLFLLAGGKVYFGRRLTVA